MNDYSNLEDDVNNKAILYDGSLPVGQVVMNKKTKKYLYTIGGLVLAITGLLSSIVTSATTNSIPTTSVQRGYVKPNQLEIKAEDLTGDGNNETVMEYQGKKYLLIEKDGMPKVQSYNIIPTQSAQIIYKDN